VIEFQIQLRTNPGYRNRNLFNRDDVHRSGRPSLLATMYTSEEGRPNAYFTCLPLKHQDILLTWRWKTNHSIKQWLAASHTLGLTAHLTLNNQQIN